MGPDFYGTGQPYGTVRRRALLLAGWQADLRHLEPHAARRRDPGVLLGAARRLDHVRGLQRRLQGRPRLRHQRPRPRPTSTPGSTPSESAARSRTSCRPSRRGRWTGVFEVYGADQKQLGNILVTVEHEPLSLVRYRQTTTWEGVLNRRYTVERTRMRQQLVVRRAGRSWATPAPTAARSTSRSTSPAPDVWKIKGREFLLDESLQMAVTWMAYGGELLTTSCTACSSGRRRLMAASDAADRVVVVTGSTRGIGLGLAKELLTRGARVVISGRSQESVDKALAALGAGDQAVGMPARRLASRTTTRRCGTTPSRRSAASTSGSTTPACRCRASRSGSSRPADLAVDRRHQPGRA